MDKTVTGAKILLKRIAKAFPNISWDSYEYVSEGWDHEVIILDGRLVFRFPNDALYSKILKTEIRLLKALRSKVLVAVPDYKYIAPNNSFAGYELIGGAPLSKKQFKGLSAKDKTSLAKQLAGLLSTMHSFLRTNKFTIDSPSFKDDQKEAWHITKTKLSKKLPAKEFATAEGILKETDKLLLKPIASVLIHGDIYNRHLLWDYKTKKLGVIDFSDACKSDPAFDFSEIHEYGLNFVKEVYKYYKGPKDKTFLQRAWTYQQWAGVFMMADHFINHKTSFETAKETFNWSKTKQPPL